MAPPPEILEGRDHDVKSAGRKTRRFLEHDSAPASNGRRRQSLVMTPGG